MLHGFAGVSLLGVEKDITSGALENTFKSFRPTVAFALQETYPLDSLYLLYEKDHSDLLTTISREIQSKSDSIKIKPIAIEYTDPYDFDNCFSVLSSTLSSIRKKSSQELLLSVNTGTHTMRFSLVLMVEKGLIDSARLVYVSPGSTSDPILNHTLKAGIRLLEHSLEASSTFTGALKQARIESLKAITPVDTKNLSVNWSHLSPADDGSS